MREVGERAGRHSALVFEPLQRVHRQLLAVSRALGGQQPRLADDFVGSEADDAALRAAAAAHRERLPGARLTVRHHADVLTLQHRRERRAQ